MWWLLMIGCQGDKPDEVGVVGRDSPSVESRPADSTESGSTESAPPLTTAEQCAAVCDAYAACGCEARCDSWCVSYLDWSLCQPEIAALIGCAAGHPSPCTWGEESYPEITCNAEIQAFTQCSGNVFFPLPGVPQVCEP